VSSGCIVLMMTPTALASSWYPDYFRAEFIVHTLGDCAMLALYPPFLAVALQEGGISDKERSLLVRLRDSLGITESDAYAIEGELQQA